MSSFSASELTPELATKFARLALGHVTRPYPYKLDHVMAGDEDVLPPRVLHPIFHGSFDWHSCVHGYWLLARLMRRFPGMAPAAEIRVLFERMLSPENVAGELAYLARPESKGFERPYGWAWLLMLGAELECHEGASYREVLRPLARAFAQRFKAFLPKATYPIRTGTHFNTAFALALASEYAEAVNDHELARLIEATARGWYLADAAAPAWEPSGDDFLSPTLIEAECLRRLLPAAEFRPWFARFLPRAADRMPECLFKPAIVSDRSDGKIAHLDGLNLSRAWCFRSIAGSLPADDPVRSVALSAADEHLAAGLAHVAGDYMGEHWLATFALLALEAG
ncbi:DUF2891 domain-containing protein [Polyangium jinanense]|uniref:DUF2891 domain-containing protein n=1 Tax=Polyangium jinanense TaxID=2829994 RepID=A0A9X4ARL2_9BACT|nr:DUF2891 domain-containing protein [Polyangium jinanense]MDC3955260.1 DUF2891 domain-containing protein [Polyangium jinanense]MDC3981561.1 DUF2891 domain-containing protein [Polyangium jinanense]